MQFPIGFLEDLAAAGSLRGVMDVAASWLLLIVEADRASIALLDDDKKNLSVFSLGGNEAIPLETKVPMVNTLVGEAVARRDTLYTPDLAASDRLDAVKLVQGGLSSSLSVPLISSGRTYGSVNVGSANIDAFSTDDSRNLSGLGGLVASYLRVHSQVEREQDLARTDELTGLLSRRAIIGKVRTRLRTADLCPTALLFVDLDGFKLINDAYGHIAGDVVLRHVAERFTHVLRNDDTIGRLGGDEFLILLGQSSDESAALGVAKRLVEVCSQPVSVGSSTVSARASIGVAISTDNSDAAESLLSEADLAMYRAKRSRSQVVLADASVRRHADLVAAVDRDLERALQDGGLSFHYQPVRRLDTNEILGCEALVRWVHPVHGWVPAQMLVDRVEANGLTASFSRWCLDRAARDLCQLRKLDPTWQTKTFSLNLSATQLEWPGYTKAHLGTLVQYGLKSSDLGIELVDSWTVKAGSVAEQTLQELGSHGMPIGLDDFGTGHNVFSYFSRFPVKSIKVDRSLIASIGENETARKVVDGLVRLARDLDIEATAEGIERPEQVDICRQIGINRGQGYLLAYPMSIEELIELDEEPVASR